MPDRRDRFLIFIFDFGISIRVSVSVSEYQYQSIISVTCIRVSVSESQSKSQSLRWAIGAGPSTAVVDKLREVGDLLQARILAAVAAPLNQDLVTLAVQHPPRGILAGRWIVEGVGIGGAQLVLDRLSVLDQDALELLT